MLVVLALIIFSGLFTFYDYKKTIRSLETQEQVRLLGIAKTISSQINGEEHLSIYEDNEEKNAIKSSNDNESYRRIHELLKVVKHTNNLPSDLYTAVYNEEDNNFDLVVTSNDEPYFRHKWKQFDQQIIEELNTGGSLECYKSENGIWLSSFAPIKGHGSEFSAIVQVDLPFGPFIKKTQRTALKNAAVLALLLLVASVILYSLMVRIVRKEMEVKKKLAHQNQLIKAKNKNIISSIQSAKRIQESILPPLSKIKKEFPDFFVVYKPKDIVSGDFFWYHTIGSVSYFAVADCTGHGVPGAMVTMLGQTILKDIIKGQEDITPAQILMELNRRLERTINHNKFDIPEGMDISLCRMSRNEDVIQYAGAFRSMLMIREGEMSIINGNKFSIGGIIDKNKVFENRTVNVQKGDRFYLFSDGYCDQFGGEKGKKYMSRRFKRFILDNQDLRMEDQEFLFNYEFHLWQQEEEQVDDVLVAGFEIPGVDYSSTSFPHLRIVA